MNHTNKKQVLIADDHKMFADGIAGIVNELDDFQVSGIVNDGKKLLHALNSYPVDLILLDLNMPQLDGFQSAEIIKRRFPDVKIIVISTYDETKKIEQARALGVNGFLSKNLDSKDLVHSMRQVIRGTNIFHETEKTVAKEASVFTDAFMEKYSLTKRESEIIKLIVEELSSKAIADKLHISESTVETHRKNICRKLRVNSTLGIYKIAVREGGG